MLVTRDYCVTMARYNAWQNKQLRDAFEALSDAELRKERKAFFGSIFKTANHILWADRMWMYRLGIGDAPEGDHLSLTPTPAVWAGERYKTDARLIAWAEKLDTVDLKGDVVWRSVMADRDFTHPFDLCVSALFNHQTHHRGQIHAMLTAAGATAPVTDLLFMPEEGPWL
ncbi:DinB family protein [Marivita hallyeonensis]|uniref:Uncharacterized damage-inducible protein DinB (Forms a four-helix bundle) n=1 Tax=Marivita hallyeonensis TaxID=996342 RepID=A0A1M5VXK5_9RHOB|nr:DinB family protein [Marivita hallyeonensis]SHH79724.1 Uncharacterized damage-inducible protein DinB (forms a four-helix bundle) [Marivita hallyeonensis]